MMNRATDHDGVNYESKRRHFCDKENDIEEIKDDVKAVKKLLVGNGVLGVAEMARRSFEWMEASKKSNQGLFDWAFRAFITILVTFVAVKVGLK